MRRNSIHNIGVWISVACLFSTNSVYAQAGATSPSTTPVTTSSKATFTPQQLSSISIAPIPSNEKELKITFTAKPGTKPLPEFVVAMVNDKEVKLTDEQHNGHFVGTVAIEEAAKLKQPLTVPVVNGKTRQHAKAPGGGVTVAPPHGTITCKIETVDCPPDCKSTIFGTKCWICLKITCTVKL